MEKIINYENLRSFAYVSDKICEKPIKGVVVDLFGLGDMSMFWEDPDIAEECAKVGIMYVIPYNNPWAWMNPQSIAFTDEILDVIFEKYELSENTPIVSVGGSMGGLASLVYTKYAKRTPVACLANCPVCDLPYHYTERPDLPRTLYSAFFNEEGSLDDEMKKYSPYHLASEMPDIEYHIFHCDADGAVNIDKHSNRFVEAMRANGKKITYDIVPDRNHCDLTPEAREKYNKYMFDSILKLN